MLEKKEWKHAQNNMHNWLSPDHSDQTHGSVLQGQEEAACMCFFRPMQPLQ